MKQAALYLLIAGYFMAGVNHFWHPKSYYKMMPPYLPAHYWMNIIAGIAEMVLAVMMIFPQTRLAAAYLIIAMLIVFIPIHVYLFKAFPNAQTIVWIRLVLIHPLLIYWAWYVRC